MTTLIEVKDLVKNYKEKTVVHGINFSINQGEILCFLGPNGAGKSTTITILCGILGYDQGEILYKNQSIKNLRLFKSKLGIVPQEIALYEELTAEDNVRFFASLYGLKGEKLRQGITSALEKVALSKHRNEKVATFSGGMKRRLNIACAIAHEPELLIMDEPTVGIDPQSRNHILNAIKKMNVQGMTILYTTHYMEEVEEISTRIIIMDHGTIIAEGTKEQLKDKQKERCIVIDLFESTLLNQEALYQIEGVITTECKNNQLRITTIKGIENLDKLISILTKQKLKITNLSVQADNLETVFLDLTGRSLRD